MSKDPFAEQSTQEQFLLKIHLSAMVPIALMELKQRGGPDDLDYERVRSYATELGAKGDAILYPVKAKGQSAEMVSKLVEAIAVLAFLPGGITIFGMHFNASGIPKEQPENIFGASPLSSTIQEEGRD